MPDIHLRFPNRWAKLGAVSQLVPGVLGGLRLGGLVRSMLGSCAIIPSRYSTHRFQSGSSAIVPNSSMAVSHQRIASSSDFLNYRTAFLERHPEPAGLANDGYPLPGYVWLHLDGVPRHVWAAGLVFRMA